MGACASKQDAYEQGPPARPFDPNDQSAQEQYRKQQLRAKKKKKTKKIAA
jgi:hypothetical protein